MTGIPWEMLPKRTAVESDRVPAVDTLVEHGRYSPESPTAWIQLVLVRRPRATMAPTSSSRGPDRGSRAEAKRENR